MPVQKAPFSKNSTISKPDNQKKWTGSYMPLQGHFQKGDKLKASIRITFSDGGPHGNSQGIGAVNCCRKDQDVRGSRDPTCTSYLCNCNLIKSYLTSVSLLKHFFIFY